MAWAPLALTKLDRSIGSNSEPPYVSESCACYATTGLFFCGTKLILQLQKLTEASQVESQS